MRVLRYCIVASAALVLAACGTSAGDPATGFMNASVEAAFIPLSGSTSLFRTAHGAAVVIAPGIAVTNAHNANILGKAVVLGRSPHLDLLFFRTDRAVPLAQATPTLNTEVIAYGEGRDADLRVSRGIIKTVTVPVGPRCDVCAAPGTFTFESNAGPGFSGGPVVDAKTGHLLGITFGYIDEADDMRLMYAYNVAMVLQELHSAVPGSN